MISKQNRNAKIWIVDDNPANLSVLFNYLSDSGFQPFVFESAQDVLSKISEKKPDLILLDIRMPEMDGYQLCQQLKTSPDTAEIPVIFITALTAVEDKVKGFNMGAVDFITKPLQHEEVLARVNTHLNLRYFKQRTEEQDKDLSQKETQIKSLKKALKDIQQNQYIFDGIVGKSKGIRRVLELIQTASESDANVLITGETGTGKELVARSLHKNSKRKEQKFVALNCSAIPENLIESELFGYEPGAFTGATTQKIGKFEFASGGTLFLDEIGELPLSLQAKLLRVLQDRTFNRLGGNALIQTDVRIVAATNRNLEEQISEGKFREDLYYRLNVIPIYIPPLRERQEDIMLLAMHFIEKYNTLYGKEVRNISESFWQFLRVHDWKGNVRELENTIERYMVLTRDRKSVV